MKLIPNLDTRDRCSWLQLIRSENIGPVMFWQLLKRFGTAEAALDALPDLAQRGGLKRKIRICSRAKAEDELAKAAALKVRHIACGEADFPEWLGAIHAPPPLIAVRGDAGLLKKPMIGIVGARQCSAAGARFAQQIAGDLGVSGQVVVSGLARGIDGAAHNGALATGTIAVMAGGVDWVYPSEHQRLYEDILSQGAVISESAIGMQPQARDFPRRNRIISGLSWGVAVVEATLRSGSLITSRLAGEQGREVFAVPGSPLDPRAKGPNQLIKDGATLVQTADDILDAYNADLPLPFQESFAPYDDNENGPGDLATGEATQMSPGSTDGDVSLETLLGPTPVTVDELVRLSAIPPGEIALTLLELEIAGRLERHDDGRISLRPS